MRVKHRIDRPILIPSYLYHPHRSIVIGSTIIRHHRHHIYFLYIFRFRIDQIEAHRIRNRLDFSAADHHHSFPSPLLLFSSSSRSTHRDHQRFDERRRIIIVPPSHPATIREERERVDKRERIVKKRFEKKEIKESQIDIFFTHTLRIASVLFHCITLCYCWTDSGLGVISSSSFIIHHQRYRRDQQ